MWIEFLISKYNYFYLDHIGVTLSGPAMVSKEGVVAAVVAPRLSAGLAPLLATVPHHAVRSCCGMHTAVSALGV